MKWLFLTALIFLATVVSTLGQDKVDRYCVLTITSRGLKPRWVVDLLKWEDQRLFSFKDSTVVQQLELVTLCKSMPDALNYMASLGWKLEHVAGGPSTYFFRKEFDRSELVNP